MLKISCQWLILIAVFGKWFTHFQLCVFYSTWISTEIVSLKHLCSEFEKFSWYHFWNGATTRFSKLTFWYALMTFFISGLIKHKLLSILRENPAICDTFLCMKQFEIGKTKSPWNQVPSNINSSHFAKTNFDNFGYLEIAKLHIQSMYVAKWPDSKLAQCFWAKILSIFFKRGNLSILKLLHFKRDCSYLSHCMVKANYKSL